MTWGHLQTLVSSLLVDNITLHKEHNRRIALLDYALNEVAHRATALRLQTTDITSNNAIKIDYTEIYYTRKPVLPESDDDIIDIDNDLCYPVARFMASFITITSGNPYESKVHKDEAIHMINRYNDNLEAIKDALEN